MTTSERDGGIGPPNGRVDIDTDAPSQLAEDVVRRMNQKIVGQARAAAEVGYSVEIDAAGLYEPGDLTMQHFLAGPPGVGKTETAYQFGRAWIGDLLRGSDGHVLQPISLIDCTLYTDSHDVANLKGSTKGYVGYEDRTPLAQALIDRYAIEVLLNQEIELYLQEKAQRMPPDKPMPPLRPREREHVRKTRVETEKPFKKVILFDEVGRAHRNVWNILITLMNGKPFEFGDGSKADFTRAALLMSDNTNEQEIKELMRGGIGFRDDWREADPGKLSEMIYKQTLRKIEKVFPAPFVSRVRKNIIVFNPLDEADWRQILDLRLAETSTLFEQTVGEQIGEAKPVFTEACKQFLLERGIDRLYGARPLKQVLRKHVLTRMARALNAQALKPGDHLVFDRERHPSDRLVTYVER